MQKRIYLYFAGLILLCVVLLATSFSILLFNAAQTHEMAAIRDKAYLIAELLDQGVNYHRDDRSVNRFNDFTSKNAEGTRMTIITPDGSVLLDSHATAELLENRADRAEFRQALFSGSGEAIRYSRTLSAETYYYAIQLQDGNVLRFSRTLNSLVEVFVAILPALIAVAVIILVSAHFIAHNLSLKIIKPLSEVDFESADVFTNNVTYEELWPYFKKIDRQKQEITRQLAALKNRANTIEVITANMQEGLILLDQNGLVLAVNKSVLNIFEITQESGLINKGIMHIYRDTKFQQAVKQCLGGEHLEMPLTRKDNIYNVYLNPVTSSNAIQGAIIFFLDTTERYKAETQRREFSANVSHELKTPLTTISALSEMIAGGMAKTEDIASFATKISGQTKRLINMIDDIIRLSEFDEDKVGRKFAAFDVYELAESVAISLQEKAEAKKVTIELKGKPLQLTANSRLIDELLYNLIDNGIKYNKDGGKVTISLLEENGWCKITISDTGIGIPKEHQERIFERFYRVDNSRSKRTGGTGLGLSIVKHIVEHHDGKIILESAEGVGTTIICYIAVSTL